MRLKSTMTTTKELIDALREADRAKENVRKLVGEEGPAIIGKALQETLVDCPNVVLFWRQGTPSFNDGDPCRFRIHDLWICPGDTDPSDLGEDTSIDNETGKRYTTDEDQDPDEILCTPEQLDNIYKVWSELSDLFEDAFGEARVTISIDSVSIDEFDWY